MGEVEPVHLLTDSPKTNGRKRVALRQLLNSVARRMGSVINSPSKSVTAAQPIAISWSGCGRRLFTDLAIVIEEMEGLRDLEDV